MSESENASTDNDVWEYISEHPKMLGVPITDSKGLDILSALRDVYVTLKHDKEMGLELLTVLASILISSSQGNGDKIIEDITVFESMIDFDIEMKRILNEEY